MQNNNDYNNNYNYPGNNSQDPQYSQNPQYNQQYNGYGYPGSRPPAPAVWQDAEEFGRAVNSCLTRVFLRMFAALVVTAIAAFYVASSPAALTFIFGNTFVYIVLIIVELGLVIGISAGINKLSATAANVLFFLFAIVNGLTLAVIFVVYDIGIIYHAFAVTALMFGGMALYGAIAKTDLSAVGSICIMGLFGIIIASVVNMFFANDTLDMIICYVGVLVFIGLTAYDTQRIKRMLEAANADAGSGEIAVKKISVIGALTLYLDFINLFLKLLRILGRRN